MYEWSKYSIKIIINTFPSSICRCPHSGVTFEKIIKYGLTLRDWIHIYFCNGSSNVVIIKCEKHLQFYKEIHLLLKYSGRNNETFPVEFKL